MVLLRRGRRPGARERGKRLPWRPASESGRLCPGDGLRGERAVPEGANVAYAPLPETPESRCHSDTRLVWPADVHEIGPRLRLEDLTVGCYEPDSGYSCALKIPN